MPIPSGRWALDATNLILYRDTSVTPTVTDTSNAMYSSVMETIDNASWMDDTDPITAQTPTEYTIVKQWFFPDESAKYLTGGAIQTSGYTNGTDHFIRAVEYDASGAGTMFEANDVGETITGGTSGDTGTILAWDERFGVEIGVVWVRVDDPTPGGDEFNASETFTVSNSVANGNITDSNSGSFSHTGEQRWTNANSIGNITDYTRIYAVRNGVKIGSDPNEGLDSWPAGIGLNADGAIDVLIKVVDSPSGGLIDNGDVIFFARTGGDQFAWFELLNMTGRVAVPIATALDLDDSTGHYNVTWTGGAGSALVVGDIVSMDANSESAGIVVNVTDSGATGNFDYFLIRGLTQLTNAAASGESPSTKTMTLGTPTNLTPVTDTDITVSHTATTVDLGNGAGSRPYSIEVDPNSKSFQRVYERLKYVTRRGETGTTSTDGQPGEQYRGSQVQLEYGTQTGAFVEGETVYGQTSGATGVIVADHDDGATGDLILRDVKGTFSTEVIGDAPSAPTDFATVTSVRTIPTVATAPFGTYPGGGTFFAAPGVFFTLVNIATGEEQAYSLIDDDGTVQTPPNTVGIAIEGLEVGDRGFIARVQTAGGTDIIKDEYTSHATNNVLSGTTFEVQESISQEAPATCWIRVEYDVDAEDRYWVSSWTGSIFTLDAIPDATITTGDPNGITITASGSTFQTDGVKPGMMVRNTSDGSSIGTIATVNSETVLTLEERLVGGTENDFDNTDVIEINQLVRAYDGSDTAYVPFIDDVVESGNSLNAQIIQSVNINTLARVRQGKVIEPFEQLGLTINASGLTVQAIRNDDTIAT